MGGLCPAQALGCMRLLGALCWLTSWHSVPLGFVLSSLSWEDMEGAILGKNAAHLDLGPLNLPFSGSGKCYGAWQVGDFGIFSYKSVGAPCTRTFSSPHRHLTFNPPKPPKYFNHLTNIEYLQYVIMACVGDIAINKIK